MVSAVSNPHSPGSSRPSGIARPFVLRPDWNGVVQKREVVDVNLGHTPESFVRAAHAQITGETAPEALVKRFARELRSNPRLRRVDLVRLLASESGRECELCYGDPWQAHPQLLGAPERQTKRQIGAVLTTDPALGNGAATTHPLDGDWKRELTDAKWAGLDFLLLSVSGGELQLERLRPLLTALGSLSDPVKLALLDRSAPGSNALAAYEAKWQPFFRQVDRHHWYRFKGKPFVYLGGDGGGAGAAAPEVLAELEARFETDHGERPFLCAEQKSSVEPRSRSTLDGHVIDHATVKGSELLEQVLHDSSDAELLVLTSWNDLGEGTGIHRNYDYWANGSWLSPEHFMRKIRVSQSMESYQSARRYRDHRGNGLDGE
jgi:hypothetical protein